MSAVFYITGVQIALSKIRIDNSHYHFPFKVILNENDSVRYPYLNELLQSWSLTNLNKWDSNPHLQLGNAISTRVWSE